ncbi:cytochrome P450 [Kibdelosporangium banguiense]|uniref:Cytochrome P450 n=1 Tax=Kibdelosporangium banguiense TaxID=1365924 RepID=A0ABS4TZ94_9PSEU|nr:cytochrome P450 [Kibdelosporangium banguiense]MBP2329722.1 cytochrome P450 [Kibdelosporangium banguiense]
MKITSPALDARVPLDDVDMYDPTRYPAECQHTLWQTLRHEEPVLRQVAPNGTEFWSVMRYWDCDRLLKEHETFTSEYGTILQSVGVGDMGRNKTMTVSDPPQHGQFRNPVLRKLSREVIRRCTEEMTERINRLILPLLADGGGELMTVLHKMPMAMLAPMMGIPEELADDVAHWTAVSVTPDEPSLNGGISAHAASMQAHIQMLELFDVAIKNSRENPGDDVMTALTQLLLNGEPLTDEEVQLNCYSLMMGAHATTPHVASQTIIAMMDRPALWDTVREDPSLVPDLVHEGTRWTSPTNHLLRRAAKDTELGGVPIAEGDWMCGWVGSANRDSEVWSDPYEFRLDRSPRTHLGFGVGPHFCIGAMVSQAALTILFETLARHVHRFELVGEPRHLVSNWINGMSEMTISVEVDRAPV